MYIIYIFIISFIVAFLLLAFLYKIWKPDEPLYYGGIGLVALILAVVATVASIPYNSIIYAIGVVTTILLIPLILAGLFYLIGLGCIMGALDNKV